MNKPERNIDNQTEKIYQALDMLCDALELGRSESSTERLFWILSEAFTSANKQDMETELEDSHAKGLSLDMRGLIADKIKAHNFTWGAKLPPLAKMTT
jgi:hypothetical protein